jgi:hypothetical protein
MEAILLEKSTSKFGKDSKIVYINGNNLDTIPFHVSQIYQYGWIGRFTLSENLPRSLKNFVKMVYGTSIQYVNDIIQWHELIWKVTDFDQGFAIIA